MTAPHQIGLSVEDGSLPVSSELLSLLSSFSAQVGVIFDELSRNPQQAGSSSTFSSDFAQPLTVLSELDERLAVVLQRAKIHHANQTRIKQLEDQLVQYELDWRKEMLMLEEQRKVLKRLVDAGNKDKAAIERAQKAALKPSTVLSYARMLAPFTSAPPRLKPISGEGPGASDHIIPPGGILPYPTEETMRRGRLAFAEVGDIGETGAMTGVKPQSPPAITQQQPIAPGVQPVGNQAARKPLAAISQPEEDEDFGFDLDLNPDL